MTIKTSILALSLGAVMIAGCAKPGSQLPKGAINTFDADSYQSLVTAQAALNSFKSQADSLSSVPQFKAILNQAITDYNVAEGAWQTYHAGGGNSTAVTAALSAVAADVLKLEGLIPTGASK